MLLLAFACFGTPTSIHSILHYYIQVTSAQGLTTSPSMFAHSGDAPDIAMLGAGQVPALGAACFNKQAGVKGLLHLLGHAVNRHCEVGALLALHLLRVPRIETEVAIHATSPDVDSRSLPRSVGHVRGLTHWRLVGPVPGAMWLLSRI